jgi:hypothetical protein
MPEKKHTYNPICIESYKPAFYMVVAVWVSCMGLMLPATVAAQNIGNWTFNNILTGTPGLFNTVSTADFSSSVPIHSFNGGTEYFGENGWPAGALNSSMYLQFSLTPAAGYQLDISSLIITIRRSNTGSPAGAGPNNWSLRSSLDGFTTDIASGSMTYNYANYTVTPGSSFLNLYTTITFRLYGYNTTVNAGGSSRLVVDNITVKGLGYLLPVTLGDLTAAITEDRVNLSYTVYNTEVNSRYSIERSTDGIHFSTVNTTEETSAAAEKKYACTDVILSLPGVSTFYYRVHLLSNSGTDIYSAITMAKTKNSTAPVKIFISNGQLHIAGSFPEEGSYQAIIYSTNGQVITRVAFNAAGGYNTFTLPVNSKIPAGYIVQVGNNKGYSSAVLLANP